MASSLLVFYKKVGGYDSEGQPSYKNTTTGEVVTLEYLRATLPLGDTVTVK